jgi:hypothetical protein
VSTPDRTSPTTSRSLWDQETLAWLTGVREQYDPTGMFRTVGLR